MFAVPSDVAIALLVQSSPIHLFICSGYLQCFIQTLGCCLLFLKYLKAIVNEHVEFNTYRFCCYLFRRFFNRMRLVHSHRVVTLTDRLGEGASQGVHLLLIYLCLII